MQANESELVFLKLGGSLITDKTRAETVHPGVLDRLAAEVRRALRERPGLRLLLGHGSGSFGHVAAQRHNTRAGVHGPTGWLGFAEVADAAARLDRIVVRAFLAAGVPAWSIQPSASSWCQDGNIVRGQGQLITRALDQGLVPVVYGDALLDSQRGGTIVSTEELFAWLVSELTPCRIILAGTVDGVYSADPLIAATADHWPTITPEDLPDLRAGLGKSFGIDVTGGMVSKVEQMCQLVSRHPGLQVRLISGLRHDSVYAALLGRGDAGGTVISHPQKASSSPPCHF